MEKLINIHIWIGRNSLSIENHHRDSEQFNWVVLEICGDDKNLNICDIYMCLTVKLNMSERKQFVCRNNKVHFPLQKKTVKSRISEELNF